MSKLRTTVKTIVLVLGLSGAEIALASSESSFNEAWNAYSQSYVKLNKANEDFTQKITPHMAKFKHYGMWMDETIALLSHNDAKPLDVEFAFAQYRELLKNDTTCAGASLQTLQSDLHQALRTLKKDFAELNSAGSASANGKSKTDRDLKKHIKKSISDAEAALGKAEATIQSYSESLNASNICQTLSSFDLILVAADTLSTSRNSSINLKLANFLNNANQQKDPVIIKSESIEYLKAVETAYIRSLKNGEVTKTLLLLNRLDGNIAFGTSASKHLSDLEKAEIESIKTLVKSKIRSLSEEMNFPKFPGLVQMLGVKTRLVYDSLLKAERSVVRASDQELFADVKAYCRTEFRMRANDPLNTLSPKHLTEVLELDAKLSIALLKLKTLENSQDLASR